MAVLTSGFAAEKGDELALADDTRTRTWAEFGELLTADLHDEHAVEQQEQFVRLGA